MVLAGLAFVACAMFSVPSFAATTDPDLYAVSVDDLDYIGFTETILAPGAAVLDEPKAADRAKKRSPGILKPVYEESFRTDGRSLGSYHRRC